MDALLLSQYFWPEETATSDMLSGMAFAMARRVGEVRAVAGQPSYRGMEHLPTKMTERGVAVRRVWSTQWDRGRIGGRVLNTASFTASAFAACAFGRRADVLMAVTNPPLLPWAAWAARGLRGVPYVLVIHDVYPHVAVALGRIKAGSTIDRLWRTLNRWAYRGAAAIVALGDCMAEVIRGELPPDQRWKVTVIPNWADGDRIRPQSREGHPLIREWKIPSDHFVVLYSGNIGLFHDMDIIIEAADRLRHEPVHIVIQGDGGQLARVRRAVEERRLDKVRFLPFQARETLPQSLTACDAGLVTLKNEVTGFCVPSKLYGIMAAGKPVICVANEASETARAVRRHDCGVVVRPGDSETLADQILKLKADANRLRNYGNAARWAYEWNYTLPIVASRYADIVERACESASALKGIITTNLVHPANQ